MTYDPFSPADFTKVVELLDGETFETLWVSSILARKISELGLIVHPTASAPFKSYFRSKNNMKIT